MWEGGVFSSSSAVVPGGELAVQNPGIISMRNLDRHQKIKEIKRSKDIKCNKTSKVNPPQKRSFSQSSVASRGGMTLVLRNGFRCFFKPYQFYPLGPSYSKLPGGTLPGANKQLAGRSPVSRKRPNSIKR